MPNGANGTSDPSTPRLPPSSGSCRTTDATRRRGKHRRVRTLHGESSTGMALVTRVGARERGQRTSLKSEIKLSALGARSLQDSHSQLRPGPTGHKFRGAASGAPRKNRTSETRRLARSIRDVAFASRRESDAEARPRCGSGDRLTWTQLSAQQAQLFSTNDLANPFIRNRCKRNDH